MGVSGDDDSLMAIIVILQKTSMLIMALFAFHLGHWSHTSPIA